MTELTCFNCSGTGTSKGFNCSVCLGSGKVKEAKELLESKECPKCLGLKRGPGSFVCPECGGSGETKPSDIESPFPTKGQGNTNKSKNKVNDSIGIKKLNSTYSPCWHCNGHGVFNFEICEICRGDGIAKIELSDFLNSKKLNIPLEEQTATYKDLIQDNKNKIEYEVERLNERMELMDEKIELTYKSIENIFLLLKKITRMIEGR